MAFSSPSLQIPPLLVSSRKSPSHHIVLPRTKISKTFLHHSSLSSSSSSFFSFSSNTLKCSAQRKPTEEFERLFSNVNQVTLKREPGSLTSAIFLVAGTTVGAGILAIPAVTQEAGFVASAITCILCWMYMVVTGLLIAEVNVNTMCELGSGGVSLVSMARRTLGKVGVQIACWSYIFIHYALLVAYVARSSDILTNFLGIPSWESATLFSLVLGGICYYGRYRGVSTAMRILVFQLLSSSYIPTVYRGH